MSLLIKNAQVLANSGLLNAEIAIENGKIVQIGAVKESLEETIDAKRLIAIPGLVNTHTHLSMTLFRGLGEDLPLDRWLKDKIWPLEKRQTKKQIELAAKLGICEMIQGGTTAFADMCLFDTKPLFDVAEKIGIRGLIARGVMDFGDFDKAETRTLLKEIEKSLDYGKSGEKAFEESLCKSGIAAHAPYTCSEEFLIETKKIAKKKGLVYQIHVSETRKEIFECLNKAGKYPYEYLDSIGLMDESSIFAHGGWLTKREMKLAGDRKLNVSSCPVSNLKLATGGIAQITELDKAGANVCLGTDSVCSNNSLNMFETMKFASLLQKHHYWKADVISTKRIFEFATINGAKALGINSGILEKGKNADIVLIKPNANFVPINDIYSNLVYSCGPQNVEYVIINGKIVMEKGEIKTINEEELLEEAEEMKKEFR